MTRTRNAERDDRIEALYRGGAPARVVAQRIGVTERVVRNVVQRRGARRDPAQLAAAARAQLAANRARPGAEARRVAASARAHTIWPDCPAQLADDYRRIRNMGFRAREARAMLEPGA